MIFANPVLEKELRVLSHRGRLYVLRSLIILVLTGLFWFSWYSVVNFPGLQNAAAALRMGLITRSVVAQVMWIQFLGMPLVAVVLFSACLSEELRLGTLDVLRTTPASHLQLMLGKLISRLLFLASLLALSLPVYMVMRIWGGIRLDYLGHCFACIAVTTLLAASLSVWLSVHGLRPCQVVMAALFVLIGLHGVTLLSEFSGGAARLIGLTVPFTVMQILNNSLVNAQATVNTRDLSWFYVVMGGASMLLLLGTLGRLYFWQAKGSRAGSWAARRNSRAGRSTGALAVTWLELRSWQRLLGVNLMWIFCLGGPVAAVLLYGIKTQWQGINIMAVRELCITTLELVIIVSTATTATFVIGRERDTRSWVGLLATPLSHGQILRGKAWAVWAQNIAGWLIMLTAIVMFWWCMGRVGQFMDPDMHKWRLAIAMCRMIGFISFAIGVGFYFGVRLRTSMAALIGSCLTILAAYAIHEYGLQVAFSSWIVPLLQKQRSQKIMMQGFFGYGFAVAGLQCVAGILFYGCARWRMRKYLF